MSSDLLSVLSNAAGWIPGVQGFSATGFSANLAIVAISSWIIGFLVGRSYLGNRVAYLLTQGALPEEILLLTFTNKASGST